MSISIRRAVAGDRDVLVVFNRDMAAESEDKGRDVDAWGLRLYVEKESSGAQATYRALGMYEMHYQLWEEDLS